MTNQQRALRLFLKRPTAVMGAVIVLSMLMIALFAPVIASHDPQKLAVPSRLQAPGGEHLFGTDDLGRDVFSRIVHGSRLSLQVGFFTMLLGSAGGIVIGLVAGYWRRFDSPIMRLMDGLMAFPGILLAIAIMAALGPRVINVIIALTIVSIPRIARVVRAQVLVIREMPFVEAIQAAGASDSRIIWRHVLPNCLSPVIVQGTFLFATAVLSEASLSFLGVGAPPTIPSWGIILSEGRSLITKAPWLTMFPGLGISLSVLGLNLMGDGLRDALDPRMRDL
jgi:peptide/nickel transport system permease protein